MRDYRTTFGLTLLLAAGAVAAADGADEANAPTTPVQTSPVQHSFANIVALGPGVHRIKTDDDGRVRSCIIVAQAPITTVFGPARGLQVARSRAELAASAEFIKWIKRSTDVREASETETIVVLEGINKAAERTRQETGKRVEKDTSHYTVATNGLVRGLQVLHVDVDGEEGTYTLVMGWSAEGAAAARQAANDNDDGSAGRVAPRNNGANAAADTSVRSRSATAEDAQRFLD